MNWRASGFARARGSAKMGLRQMAFYRLEAAGHSAVVQLNSPLTASEAYRRAVELRRQGFSSIVAINTDTGRRITEVERLLKDLHE